jgi:hypothetical protein
MLRTGSLKFVQIFFTEFFLGRGLIEIPVNHAGSFLFINELFGKSMPILNEHFTTTSPRNIWRTSPDYLMDLIRYKSGAAIWKENRNCGR